MKAFWFLMETMGPGFVALIALVAFVASAQTEAPEDLRVQEITLESARAEPPPWNEWRP